MAARALPRARLVPHLVPITTPIVASMSTNIFHRRGPPAAHGAIETYYCPVLVRDGTANPGEPLLRNHLPEIV